MTKSKIELEEIHGFMSPGEYLLFVNFINSHINIGTLKEVPVDLDYGPGEIYGGRWFLNNKSGEIWRLIPPDFPFKGIFEKVKIKQV